MDEVPRKKKTKSLLVPNELPKKLPKTSILVPQSVMSLLFFYRTKENFKAEEEELTSNTIQFAKKTIRCSIAFVRTFAIGYTAWSNVGRVSSVQGNQKSEHCTRHDL